MGHTTRSMPIVRHLKSCGHTVILAGNEQQRAYWKVLAPDLLTLPLQGYGVRYDHKSLRLSVLSQLPKILSAIKGEHRWLLQAVKAHQIDGIISDNRYGLYHPEIPSVIITHQLRILSGAGGFADSMLQRLHYSMLGCFNACWVPDVAGENNLAGKLSHPQRILRNTKYIGLLSALALPVPRKEQHILILLSGPEPQRTALSKKLWMQAITSNYPIVFVEGGSSEAPMPENIPPHVQWHARLSGDALQCVLEAASLVICRSGYSTLMDLALLRKKAILIPTPGQTEQEYLAASLSKKKAVLTFSQKDFSLPKALQNFEDAKLSELPGEGSHVKYTGVIDNWIATL